MITIKNPDEMFNLIDQAINVMDAEVLTEIIENNIDKFSFEEKKKLMLLILDSCQSGAAQQSMIRDTFFN